MTMTDTEYGHETDEYRQRLAHDLHKIDGLPLAAVAGFMDAIGGRGWGPVGTPTLLASGKIQPRKVIGSIDTSEFLISLAASIGFLAALGSQGINFSWVAMLFIGGAVAAPIAAWLVRTIPPRILGSLVGGLIVLTNSKTIMGKGGLALDDAAKWVVYGLVWAVWIAAVAYSMRAHRAEVAAEATATRDSDERELVGEPV